MKRKYNIKPETLKARLARKKARIAKIKELKQQGLTNSQIAEKLFISVVTVNHDLDFQKDTYIFKVKIEIDAYTEDQAIAILNNIQKKHLRII